MCYSTATSSVYENRDILPSNVKPTHYDIELKPDLNAFTFAGTVKIKQRNHCTSSFISLSSIEVTEATKSISLNSQEMSDFKATVTIGDK